MLRVKNNLSRWVAREVLNDLEYVPLLTVLSAT